MKQYRVGIDFHTWDGIFQGSRSHILGIYRQAIKLAPDLTFVFFLNDTEGLGKAYPEFLNPNVELVKIKHVPSWWRLLVQLPYVARKHKIDILHTQYRVPLWSPVKTACTIHDLLCESHPQYFSPSFVWQSKITFKYSAKKADALFSVSEYSKQEIVSRYGIPASRVHVTFTGVDRQRFHPGQDGVEHVKALGLAPGGYILTVGRLEPRKNQANLIRAWGQLGDGAPQLVIIGQPDFRFGDIAKAQDEIAPRKVTLLDKVSDKQLPALFRHARLFAYPAFAEGFGMPVIEALASGVPVVTSNTTSLPEVTGQAGILVDPFSVTEIHAGLAQGLSDDESHRQHMIRLGAEQSAQYDWNASAKVLLAGLRDALQPSAKN
jgi:glycosyltransferase involved in cell wall biosynthesis